MTGQIIEEFNYYVNPHETLGNIQDGTSMTDFTGITQAQVDNGVELDVVVKELDATITRLKACKQPMVWGNGDLRTLKAQSKGLSGVGIQGTHRELDIKTIHQLFCLSTGRSMRGGLTKALEMHSLKFVGRPHNALDDAKNTFRIGCFYQKLLKSINLDQK